MLEDRDVSVGVRQPGSERGEVRCDVEQAAVGYGEGSQQRLVESGEKGQQRAY